MAPDLPAHSIAVVLGTRPEMVKLAGIVGLLGDAARVIHTGQHFDAAMSDVFLDELGFPAPAAHLDVGGADRGTQIGEATARLATALGQHRPQAVVVQGDTNAAVAGALAANAAEIPLVHVEAGLRSYDRRMPEEHNRVIADHLADLCCAPTEVNRANLAAEGITGERVVVTGNPVVEAVQRLLPEPVERKETVAALGLDPGRFVLATIHRPENVDDRDTLATVLGDLAELPLPVVFPIHPRTRAAVDRFGLHAAAAGLQLVEPAGYRRFLSLLAECALVVSDSGGLQEEVSVVKRPMVVVRRSTERPEVLGTFVERVEPGPGVGAAAAEFLADPAAVADRLAELPSPYGDGTASDQCVQALGELIGGSRA